MLKLHADCDAAPALNLQKLFSWGGGGGGGLAVSLYITKLSDKQASKQASHTHTHTHTQKKSPFRSGGVFDPLTPLHTHLIMSTILKGILVHHKTLWQASKQASKPHTHTHKKKKSPFRSGGVFDPLTPLHTHLIMSTILKVMVEWNSLLSW